MKFSTCDIFDILYNIIVQINKVLRVVNVYSHSLLNLSNTLVISNVQMVDIDFKIFIQDNLPTIAFTACQPLLGACFISILSHILLSRSK